MLAGKPEDQTLDLWFQEEYKKNKCTVLVYYRGKWCPYCKSYLLDWEQLLPQLGEMQGKVYGVCSETQEDCNDTVKELNLKYEGNVGGAANRLEPKDVVDNVRAMLEGKPELVKKPSIQGKLKLKF